MTPRQEALSDVINIMYTSKLPISPTGVLEGIGKAYPLLGKRGKKYINGMSFRTERRFKTEVIRHLEAGVILDYSDFAPGGDYQGYHNLFKSKK